ncbi:MAG: hypothetical protein E7391_02745 [Ruminococcaceae bacterium]|nr:hypothetical protein [Oscillospiraceae bacterium]
MQEIKRRENCFFGIHGDFHARIEDNVIIGKNVDESEMRRMCETLKPDFVQVDCKGHPGWASYPTKFDNALPQYDEDLLMLWRKVTKEYSIGLYVHFSGVYDIKYCNEHPQEAVIDAEGNLRPSVLPFSKYYDEFFIPQISEVVEKYDIDGIWIDGDCWSVKLDYRPETIADFEKTTGINLEGKAPKTQDDLYYDEYMEYTREQYRKTLRYYVDVLHKKYPKLQICSNWAFSDHMPERVSADVDFLSGDLNPLNCVNSARYAGRMLAQQNKAWDLMLWHSRYLIYKTPLIPPKHLVQIMQEASSIIALGGAFEDNISQFLDGNHNYAQINDIIPLANFLREREPYCFKGKQVHQVAMLVSTYDRYKEMTRPFSRDGMEKLMGLTSLLCDSSHSLELVCEHTLEGNYDKYPVIIVPELYFGLEKNTMDKLKEYVSNGGNLLIVGSKTSRIFSENGFGFKAEYYNEVPETPNWSNCDIGHNNDAYASKMPCYFTLCDDKHGVTQGACTILTEDDDAKVFGTLHNSLRGKGTPFAMRYGYGKGKIAVIGIDLGTQYNDGMQYLHRKLVNNILDDLYTPIAKVESAYGILELVTLEKENRLLLQLVNANGNHANPNSVTEDMILPVFDIKLSVKSDNMPNKVVLQPDNKILDFEYKNGRIYFSIDKVDIHSIVEVI